MSFCVLTNDLDAPPSVTAVYNGQEIHVPNLSQATTADRFCYGSWKVETGGGAELDFFHKCECTDVCPTWKNGYCNDSAPGYDNTYFCRCWPETEPVYFTITYETKASSDIISQYGGMNMKVKNDVSMGYRVPSADGWTNQPVGSTSTTVPIPGVFSKKQIVDAASKNDYTADFLITVNEEMQDLSKSDIGITIVDTMSETLFYTGGTMVLTQIAKDSDGNEIRTPLLEGRDFTLVVEERRHVLKISIPKEHLGPYMYEVTCSHHFKKWELPAQYPSWAKYQQAIPACPAVLSDARSRANLRCR